MSTERMTIRKGASMGITTAFMLDKAGPTTSAVEIMHRRYIKGNKKDLKYIEQEKERIRMRQILYTMYNASCSKKGNGTKRKSRGGRSKYKVKK